MSPSQWLSYHVPLMQALLCPLCGGNQGHTPGHTDTDGKTVLSFSHSSCTAWTVIKKWNAVPLPVGASCVNYQRGKVHHFQTAWGREEPPYPYSGKQFSQQMQLYPTSWCSLTSRSFSPLLQGWGVGSEWGWMEGLILELALSISPCGYGWNWNLLGEIRT